MNWQKRSFKSLKTTLDKYFAIFIRMRDCGGGKFEAKCITCSRYFTYPNLDSGHFQTRDNLATRWNEKNCNAQCQGCNRFKGGKQYEHGLAIDRRHGKGTAEMLLIKSKSTYKPSRFELGLLIDEYKSKIKEFETTK